MSNRTLVLGDMVGVDTEGWTFCDTMGRTSEESKGAICLSSARYKGMVRYSLRRIKEKTINISSMAVDFYTIGPKKGRGQLSTGQGSHETHIAACTFAAKDCTVRSESESFSERKTLITALVNALWFQSGTVLGAITTKERGFFHSNLDEGQSSKNV